MAPSVINNRLAKLKANKTTVSITFLIPLQKLNLARC